MSPRHALRLALCASALVLLHGCATPPPATAPVSAAARHLHQSFTLEGRVAASDGQRAANGAISWSHGPHADEWTMLSPLGQVVAQLVSTPRGASLLTADGQVRHAAAAADILPDLLGVPAPLEGLSHWVQATPREGARVLRRDETGRPARMSDAGWIIDYPEYSGPEADAVPRRIDASWGDARIRLIIDQWNPQH